MESVQQYWYELVAAQGTSPCENARQRRIPPLHESPMRLRIVAIVVATFSSSVFAQLPSGKRGITAEDYLQFELVSDPRVSPDGSQVVYVVSRVDRAQNRRIPSVWIAPTDGSRPPRVLIDESWSPGAPRWSPDGASIAFISSHAAGDTGSAARRGPAPRAQLWVVATGSGTPRRVTNVANGVSGCAWSPDGESARSVCRAPVRATRGRPVRSGATCGTTRAARTSSTTTGGTTTGARTLDHRRRAAARRSRSQAATHGTTPIRSGRRTGRASRSSPTGPARSSTRGATATSGTIPADGGSLTKISTSIRTGQVAALVARRQVDRVRERGGRGRAAAESMIAPSCVADAAAARP